MTRVTLRKLTKKSKLNVGRFSYNQWTIQEFIDLKTWRRARKYLIYVYFKYEKISFVDEFLDELGIKPEDRISKPGTISNRELTRVFEKYKLSTSGSIPIMKPVHLGDGSTKEAGSRSYLMRMNRTRR